MLSTFWVSCTLRHGVAAMGSVGDWPPGSCSWRWQPLGQSSRKFASQIGAAMHIACAFAACTERHAVALTWHASVDRIPRRGCACGELGRGIRTCAARRQSQSRRRTRTPPRRPRGGRRSPAGSGADAGVDYLFIALVLVLIVASSWAMLLARILCDTGDAANWGVHAKSVSLCLSAPPLSVSGLLCLCSLAPMRLLSARPMLFAGAFIRGAGPLRSVAQAS